MSVLDWDGLVFYDKKIKKHIESKLADAGLSKDGIDNILNDYASKTYINMTLEEANNKLNEVLGTTDIKYFE